MIDVVEVRRVLHRRPEIGLLNPYAQSVVLAALAGLELEVRTGERLTSVVATLEGARPGPTVLLRADTDALPVWEETGLAFASEVPGAMHACGHDAHTAMLLGAAHVLAAQRNELAGRVVFAFQPGEEGAGGAAAMVEEGLLDGVDAAFALHVTPQLPTGSVALRAGPLMASADVFTIVVRGSGGHGSVPHEAVDPITVACAIVGQLATVVPATADAWDPAVLTVGRIKAGDAPNVLPSTAELAGTVRAVSEPTRAAVRTRLDSVVAGIAAAHDADAAVLWSNPCGVTVNDAAVAAHVGAAAREYLMVHELPTPVMASEDFSAVLAGVPGAMAFLGAGAAHLPSGPVHSPRLLIDEQALEHGVALHTAVTRRLLASITTNGET
ncbi:M20 metallopeptidase family protein [Pseudonocardia sp. TRM90224]|uniref:M20 metallopeptidase family protein n=1 Tax=Pseudonocardia sp. TRM90224 TaxID=2812678 RepID=UPI001E41DDC3|nr:M20 family metallopeptidase [Pseudonocardia sp. TRM90224]